jgi:chromatin segregation and condensation protein Rec8/ScpA/Scc1 (kleisin family)
VMMSLSEKECATFTELFDQMSKRIMAVVTFIAILELARTRRIRIMQSQPFAELRIYRGEYYDAPQRSIDLVNPIEVLERAEVN